MNVLVLGSGVVGVTTAYYLHRAGHAVCVVDRQPAAARETSFANGGQVSWSSASPWAAPGILGTALGWLLRPHSPLVLRPKLDPALWRWLIQMLGESRAERFVRNKERQLRLARYSHAALAALRSELGLHYDEQRRGVLVLYREAKELGYAARSHALLDRLSLDYRILNRDSCIAHEPALRAQAAKIAAGVYFPNDESGDCQRFTTALAEYLQQRGVSFHFGTRITRLVADGMQLKEVVTDQGPLTADAYVLACGSDSPLLLKPLGLKLPVYPVKGYSLTAPVVNDTEVLQGTLTDEHFKIVITRLGNRVRAAGTAELAGYDLTLRPGRCATIRHVVNEWFGRGLDLARAEYWTGLRPMTPDNPPVLGTTPFKNLFLNTGHGTLGWTMACGSGRVLADVVSGRAPDIDLDGLTLARFS
jgi:D-amino-acid dehydrogenase